MTRTTRLSVTVAHLRWDADLAACQSGYGGDETAAATCAKLPPDDPQSWCLHHQSLTRTYIGLQRPAGVLLRTDSGAEHTSTCLVILRSRSHLGTRTSSLWLSFSAGPDLPTRTAVADRQRPAASAAVVMDAPPMPRRPHQPVYSRLRHHRLSMWPPHRMATAPAHFSRSKVLCRHRRRNAYAAGRQREQNAMCAM